MAQEEQQQDGGIVKLSLVAQNYDWGKPATSSKVAKLLNKESTDGDKPYAELWMGTHGNGPSKLLDKNILLSEYLKGDLPYLFKVLSIARSLSIQVHPNKKMAEKLHNERPNIYKDDNHKPEMAVALTRFEAMCGFRPYNEIIHFLQLIDEFDMLIDKKTKNDFINCVENNINNINNNINNNENENEMSSMLKIVFSEIMKANKENVDKAVSSLISKMTNKEKEWKITNINESNNNENNNNNENGKNEEKKDANNDNNDNNNDFERWIEINELILRLHAEYGNDVGIFSAFLLNCFRLLPNEAVFLKANLPHAYLSGDCFECMACSDNVVRAGLTPKLRDTNVLCDIVEYIAQKPQIMNGISIGKHTLLYCPNVDEFSLMVTSLNGKESETLKLNEMKNTMSDYASIILVSDGNGTINETINVRQGDCLLIPNNIDTIVITANNDSCIKVARCFTPKK